LGLQLNLILLSKEQQKGVSPLDSGGYYFWKSESRAHLSSPNLGIKTGAFYKLSNKLELELNYYYGILNVSSSKSLSHYYDFRVRQLTFGIRYKLNAHKKVENDE